jgi:type III restriction enzyme
MQQLPDRAIRATRREFMSTIDALANPVINSPYDEPARHFVLDSQGRPTGEVAETRRQSEFFVPIPKPKKGGRAKSAAPTLDLDSLTDERIEKNDKIDQLRDALRTWRLQNYPGATAISRKLLLHWSDPTREDRILFAQREAAETAIYLAEVTGRDKYESRMSVDWRTALADANAEHNAGLPRVALKMATGSGKTIVMAMLIAWQTLNKVASPQDSRFVKRFLIVAPGITIKDRLRVLQPTEPRDVNYFDVRGVVPQDLRAQLNQAEIHIVNYHQFQARTTAAGRGISANTRKLLLAGRADQGAFTETPQMVVTRVLDKLGRDKGEIVVFNDEAHHCYQPKNLDDEANDADTAEKREANDDAKVWFKGLIDVRRYGNKGREGIKTVYDLSATPFYLSGTGYGEGTIFPWVVSDFGLMDAIESGIVKVPRLPVDDNAQGKEVTYLHLYEALKIDPAWPKTVRAAGLIEPGWKTIPGVLQGALESLYASYEKSYADWESRLKPLGEPPPVMIVVTPNTSVSRLVYEWVSGYEVERDGASRQIAGNLPLFSNVVGDEAVAIPRTIIVDSRQLESGESMKDDFKKAAADEIDAFKKAYRNSNPGADVDKLDDSDLLREVMNTVGKPGKLGADVRCVVSVAMLTEGWDANTVTHVLGVRAFGSQLLCEQVVGRGLRRRSYAVDPETGMFSPEYANVYGIPFSFIPSDKPGAEPKVPEPSIRVKALDDRAHLRIEFPIVTGYRMEWPESPIEFTLDDAKPLAVNGETVPSVVQIEGIVGESETVAAIEEARPRSIAFAIAKRIMDHEVNVDDNWRPWVFPQLVAAVEQWLAHKVHIDTGFSLGHLRIAELQQKASEQVWNAIHQVVGDESGKPLVRPILNVGTPVGSTDDVFFDTRKKVYETQYSHVSHVTLDGKDGNAWERHVAKVCDALAGAGIITSYAKNDHLGLAIPYVHSGKRHEYWPDFVLRFDDRYLIVEVSGSMKSPGPTLEKARTARDSWCASVNNHGAFGTWGYLELGQAGVANAEVEIRAAIDKHREGAAIIGDPDLLSPLLTEGV